VPRDGLEFPFGGHDLRASLALGLGLLGHRALHIVGEYNALDFHCRYLGAPRLGVLAGRAPGFFSVNPFDRVWP
jgi:hypothetical protein